METSLLWAVEPECVDVSRLPPAEAPGPRFAMGPDAAKANRKIGERMVADEVRWLGEKWPELLKQYDPATPAQPMRTFDDVERVWDTVVRPRFAEFKTMQLAEGRQEPRRESIWYANWKIVPRA